jgi:hypothetical protein
MLIHHAKAGGAQTRIDADYAHGAPRAQGDSQKKCLGEQSLPAALSWLPNLIDAGLRGMGEG